MRWGHQTTGIATITYPSKIATCCYCGTRAALTLSAKARHELACATCGAPLHNLKQMPTHLASPTGATTESKRASGAKSKAQKTAVQTSNHADMPLKRKRKKPAKKRRSWSKNLFEEVFDVIEDIFD